MGGGDVANEGGNSCNAAVTEEVTVNVRCSNGSKFAVQVKLNSTVEFFKSILAEKCEIPLQQQRLIYKGRILKDDQTLQSYGIPPDGFSICFSSLKFVCEELYKQGLGTTVLHCHPDELKPKEPSNLQISTASDQVRIGDSQSISIWTCSARNFTIEDALEEIWRTLITGDSMVGLEDDHTVHLVRGFATAAPADSAATSGAGARSANPVSTTDGGSNQGGSLGGSGSGSSLFPGLGLNGLGNGNGLFGIALPEMEQMQQQLTQNPSMIRDLLNMPLVQNLMNDPETIRNLIVNNPQMREIMDRNPELAHILNDPATLRQTMEAARNPEIMREMMRNTDRAMSNIESSPEGFNMLRRMYENVQEPFLNATTMTGDNTSDLGSNPFAALLGAQGGGPTRENSTSATTPGPESTTSSPAPNTNPLPNPWASTGTGRTQTNSGARSNPTGEVRPLSPAGLGGLGFPGFEQMLGSVPDLTSFNQLMQNPTISQMMRNLLSNPQYMNQILGLNPQLQSMLDSNPQLRDMMQNPDFIRPLTSPETMQAFEFFTLLMSQQLVNFHQALSSQLRNPTSREAGQNAGGTAQRRFEYVETCLVDLGLFWQQLQTDLKPLKNYMLPQLSQFTGNGFFDTQENIRALIATAGKHSPCRGTTSGKSWPVE
ncbi:UNVERIFIED_CONTAM: Ubiquitin domain-containing protein DSK2b [Sesamum calycinum]|uniref:Ubiquitin domain-containing protein DSK2b n=1 Tax=Sesamum calycinum TaxID=2727403 RepID=A0AAW2MQH7_9LAMI